MATAESTKETHAVRPWYRRDPWGDRLPRPLARLERDFEGLMERFFGTGPEHYAGWSDHLPAANLAETEARFEVSVELPGMKPEEVKVELRNGELWISGEKKQEKEEKGKTFHRIERSYGEFRRVIPLPGMVDEEHIEACYKDGVLTVALPKSKEAQPKHIEVKKS